jgi:hypothetical protein
VMMVNRTPPGLNAASDGVSGGGTVAGHVQQQLMQVADWFHRPGRL